MNAPTAVQLAPVLGANRDGRASVDTSRGLLMTVLGEFVLPHAGAAWTQTLVALMGHLGVQEKATRQALARMEDRGWLARERNGRQTRWKLTESSADLLQQGADRIYGFGQSHRRWDEQWVVLLASVPDRDRQARYRMTRGLNWAGFGSLGQGVWISPWQEHEAQAAALLRDLGVQATSFVARVGQLGSGIDLAGQGWNLPELHEEYRTFLADTDGVGGRNDHDALAAAAELAGLVHRWRRFPFLDPDLPASVLPADWLGPTAAARFADIRADLGPRATSWWQAVESR